jgi:hypothetical protein
MNVKQIVYYQLVRAEIHNEFKDDLFRKVCYCSMSTEIFKEIFWGCESLVGPRSAERM